VSANIHSYDYLGCYQDNSARVLKDNFGWRTTIEECQEMCYERGERTISLLAVFLLCLVLAITYIDSDTMKIEVLTQSTSGCSSTNIVYCPDSKAVKQVGAANI